MKNKVVPHVTCSQSWGRTWPDRRSGPVYGTPKIKIGGKVKAEIDRAFASAAAAWVAAELAARIIRHHPELDPQRVLERAVEVVRREGKLRSEKTERGKRRLQTLLPKVPSRATPCLVAVKDGKTYLAGRARWRDDQYGCQIHGQPNWRRCYRVEPTRKWLAEIAGASYPAVMDMVLVAAQEQCAAAGKRVEMRWVGWKNPEPDLLDRFVVASPINWLSDGWWVDVDKLPRHSWPRMEEDVK